MIGCNMLERANATGYGMVPPALEEMELEEPTLVQQGSRYGIRLKAKASGMHLIRVDVENEIVPLVGTEAQSTEFMHYLTDTYKKDPSELWQTNIFGKPLFELVKDGMTPRWTGCRTMYSTNCKPPCNGWSTMDATA